MYNDLQAFRDEFKAFILDNVSVPDCNINVNVIDLD